MSDRYAIHEGDALEVLQLSLFGDRDRDMRGPDGRFLPGVRASRITEFKPGQHWREPQAFRERDYLVREYTVQGRSTGDIAAEFGITDAAVLYWLGKHNIKRRTVAEARRLKHWGLSGPANGMYGRRGAECPNWRGGVTADRQRVYASPEWKACVRDVWRRDRACCQKCGARAGRDAEQMHIHHIVSFEVEALRTELTNLVLLCITCHYWVHGTENSERCFIREVEEREATTPAEVKAGQMTLEVLS